ncbi:MAG: hypothetical protein V3U33_03375 [candidate division NC10 bacterium]
MMPTAPKPTPLPMVARTRFPWYGLGVFAIIAVFLLFIDLAADGRVDWAHLGILGAAFLVGGFMILNFLASSRRDWGPFYVGLALVVAALILLPLGFAFPSIGATAETFEVPYNLTVRNLDLTVSNAVGGVTVQFVTGAAFLVRAAITHNIGLFASHSEGDAVVANATAGNTTSFSVSAQSGGSGFFGGGGHAIMVTVQRDLSVAMVVHTTTGGVTVDVPSGVSLRSLEAMATTGGVSVTLQGVDFASGATVQASTVTGGVDLIIRQPTGVPGTVPVSASTTTGGVDFTFSDGSNAAVRIRSEVTTGGVNFDPANYEGTAGLLYAPSESTYNAAALRFDVQLSTTTGGIDIG